MAYLMASPLPMTGLAETGEGHGLFNGNGRGGVAIAILVIVAGLQLLNSLCSNWTAPSCAVGGRR